MINGLIETVRFGYHTAVMQASAKTALKLAKSDLYQQALPWIKKALKSGHHALSLQSMIVSEQYRTMVANHISIMQKLYRSVLIDQMPQEDRELIQSVLEFLSNATITTLYGVNPMEQIIGIFDIAKRRLASGEKVLRLLYDGDHAPTCLREIIQRFLAGDATKEETETELDRCTAIVKKWIPEMFSDEFLIDPEM